MAKQITLTQGYSAVVDDDDFEWLNSFKWCVWAPEGQTRTYAIRNVYPGGCNTRESGNSKRIGWRRQTSERMHRLILPGVDLIDHRDGDGLNNQRSNLRPATMSGNAQNRRKQRNNTSGFIGVTWHGQRDMWMARIGANDKLIHLGHFADPVEAARVRDAAALELHGEFAVLNFPRIPAQQGEPRA
jgi:hypothetical protein